MLIHTILLPCFFSVTLVSADNGDFGWAGAMSGASTEWGTAITIDDSGHVYTAGYFFDTVDFAPGSETANLESKGLQDVFISKFDSNGDFIWARAMGGANSEFVMSIATDASGNVYSIGTFRDTADFDPGPGIYNLTPIGARDTFISKLDSNGNFVWAKAIKGSSSVTGNGISVDASGNVYTTGSFYGTVDFDPGPQSANRVSKGAQDIFISKLDSNGDFVWAKAIGETSTDSGRALVVSNSGHVYTVGIFSGTVDFDPGPGTSSLENPGSQSIFISKFTSDGNLVWAKAIGGSNNDSGDDIAIDGSGNVYTTGFFQDTCDFDPGPGVISRESAGSDDIFISKLDSNGNFVWARVIGGNEGDYGKGIATDNSGNVYITGSFFETVDFDPGSGTFTWISAGDADIFISKLDSNGNFVWAKAMGGDEYDEGEDISVDNYGNSYTTGYFLGTVDFDSGTGISNLVSTGEDIFVVHLIGTPFPWSTFLPAIIGQH